MKAILGRKVGASQLFLDSGEVVPVTIVRAGPCTVVQRKRVATDGYSAVQLGMEPYANPKDAKKPEAGHFLRRELKPMKVLREVRVPDDEPHEVGAEVRVNVFAEGERVNVVGYTKGRGFAGGMKRWGWSGGPASHGSMSHRRIGSVGSNTYPGRPWRGRTLPGRYGNERVTIRNLMIVRVKEDENLLFLRGAVPGPRNGLVIVRAAGDPKQ